MKKHSGVHRGYGYAIVDVVNTLLVFERMQQEDRRIYTALGATTEEIPPLRPTLGHRVADLLFWKTKKTSLARNILPQTGPSGF